MRRYAADMVDRVITVAGLKGGVGKTTTAVHLAEVAAQTSATLLVDADPQGSALNWAGEAADTDRPLTANTIGLATRNGFATQLRDNAAHYDTVIIDTPPSDGGGHGIVRAAVAAADLVVIPMAPTLLEIDRLSPTLELVADQGVPAAVLIVRSRPTRSRTEAIDGLTASDIAVLDTVVPLREVIAGSYGSRPSKFWGYDTAWREISDALTYIRTNVDT